MYINKTDMEQLDNKVKSRCFSLWIVMEISTFLKTQEQVDWCDILVILSNRFKEV